MTEPVRGPLLAVGHLAMCLTLARLRLRPTRAARIQNDKLEIPNDLWSFFQNSTQRVKFQTSSPLGRIACLESANESSRVQIDGEFGRETLGKSLATRRTISGGQRPRLCLGRDLRRPESVAGIRRVKGAKKLGVRLGNGLSTDEAKALLASPGPSIGPEPPRVGGLSGSLAN